MLSNPTVREPEEGNSADHTVAERITHFMRRKENRLKATIPPENPDPEQDQHAAHDPDPYIP